MIRSERLSPVIIRSRSPMPVGIGFILLSVSLLSASSRSKVCKITELIRSRPCLSLPCLMSKIFCSAESIRTEGSSLPAVASSIISRDAVISLRTLYFSAIIFAYSSALEIDGQLSTRSKRYDLPVDSSKALFCFNLSSSVTKSMFRPSPIISCICAKISLCKET